MEERTSQTGNALSKRIAGLHPRGTGVAVRVACTYLVREGAQLPRWLIDSLNLR